MPACKPGCPEESHRPDRQRWLRTAGADAGSLAAGPREAAGPPRAWLVPHRSSPSCEPRSLGDTGWPLGVATQPQPPPRRPLTASLSFPQQTISTTVCRPLRWALGPQCEKADGALPLKVPPSSRIRPRTDPSPPLCRVSAGREDGGAGRSSKQGNDEEVTPRRRAPRAGEEGGRVHPTQEKLAAPWGSQAAVSSALGVLPHTLLSPLAPSSRQPPGPPGGSLHRTALPFCH